MPMERLYIVYVLVFILGIFFQVPCGEAEENSNGDSEWNWNGYNSLGYTRTASDGENTEDQSTLTNRLGLRLDWKEWAFVLTSQVDNFQTEYYDVDLGNDNKLTFVEKYIENQHVFGSGFLDLTTRVGTINNLYFSEGVSLGIFDMDGLYLKSRWNGKLDVDYVVGQTRQFIPPRTYGVTMEGPIFQRRGQVFELPKGIINGAQVSYLFTPGLKIGMNMVQADTEESDPIMVGSMFARYVTPKTDFFGTFAKDDSEGYSIFFRSKIYPSRKWEFIGEFRDYNKFFFPYNNAPRYMGITGGDDNDEIGFLVRLGYTPTDIVSFYVQFDRTDNRTINEEYNDYLAELRFKFSKRTTLTFAHESELNNQSSTSDAALYSFSAENGGKFSLGFNYDQTPFSKYTSTRLYTRYPVWKRNLYISCQYNYRTGVEKGKSNPRIGIDWKLFGENNLSIRYSYYPDSPDTMDLLLYLRL